MKKTMVLLLVIAVILSGCSNVEVFHETLRIIELSSTENVKEEPETQKCLEATNDIITEETECPPLFFIVRNKEESDNIDEDFRNQYIDLLHFFLMPDDKEFCTKVILFHPDTATLEGSFSVEGEKWFISISVKNVGNMDEYVKEREQKYGVKLKTMDTNVLGTVYILPVESDFHCYYFEKNNKVCCISTVDLPWEQSDELVRNITLVPFSWE